MVTVTSAAGPVAGGVQEAVRTVPSMAASLGVVAVEGLGQKHGLAAPPTGTAVPVPSFEALDDLLMRPAESSLRRGDAASHCRCSLLVAAGAAVAGVDRHRL